MKKTKVSYFENVGDTNPKTIKLEDWLKDTINPPDELKRKVLKYRTLRTHSSKKAIPCITVSALLGKHRDLNNIKKKTGFICLDIDPKENPVADMDKVKQLLSQHRSTLFAGRSTSDNGIYAIIKIDADKKFIKYFKYFEKVLKNKGIIIDKQCKDYTRLRFFSIDEKAYFNKNATVFNIPKKRKIKYKGNSETVNDTDKVEAIISIIEQNNIDITQNYSDWVKIAGSLYNSFGSNGIDYFHRISKFHPDYNKKKTDRKFENCMKMNRVSINSFFHIATSHGIRY